MDLRHRRVEDFMRVEVASLGPGDKLDAVHDLMRVGKLRHVPVLEDGRLVGMVSNRDLLDAQLSSALSFDAGSRRTFLRSVEVREVMTKDVATLAPDATLADAARLLVDRRIGCAPVVDADGTLIGLVSETDLLAAAYLDDAEADEVGTDDAEPGELRAWVERELEDLRRVRDELRVQVHLGRAEARERWNSLERSFESLEGRARRTTHAVGAPLRQLREDARLLARDLREGYRQLRNSL